MKNQAFMLAGCKYSNTVICFLSLSTTQISFPHSIEYTVYPVPYILKQASPTEWQRMEVAHGLFFKFFAQNPSQKESLLSPSFSKISNFGHIWTLTQSHCPKRWVHGLVRPGLHAHIRVWVIRSSLLEEKCSITYQWWFLSCNQQT